MVAQPPLQARPSDEAGQVAQTAHVATALLAQKAAKEVVELWRAFRQGARWIGAALKVLRLRRRQQREIVLAGERLRRALVTGQGFVHGPPRRDWSPGERGEKRDSVQEMRDEFLRKVKAYAPDALRGSKNGHHRPYTPPRGGVVGKVDLEDLDRLEARLEAEEAAAERVAEARLRRLEKEWQEQYQSGLRDPERFEKQLEGAAMREGMEGAHGAHRALGGADRRIVGWVRVHEPVNGSQPCPFCALLLSQGVAYKTAKAAGGVRGDVTRKFHDWCRCHAEPVYAGQDYDSDPRFAPNRYWRKLYDSQFAKMGTKDRYKAWRNEVDYVTGRVPHRRKTRPTNRRKKQ